MDYNSGLDEDVDIELQEGLMESLKIYKRRKEVDDIVRYEASQQESFDDLKTDAFFMHVHRSAYQLYYTWPVKGQPSVKDLWAHFAMIRQYIGLIDDEEHRDLKLHQPGKPVGKPACNYEAERVDAAWNKMFGSPLEARLKWEAQAEKKLKSQKNKRNKPDFDETGNDTAARNTPQAGTSGTSSRNRSKGVAKKPTAKKPKKGQGNIPEVATLLPLPATAPPRGGLLPSHGLLPEIAARTLGSLGEPFTIGPNCESMTFDFFMTHQEGWRFTDTAAMHSLLEISDAIKQIDKTEREARRLTAAEEARIAERDRRHRNINMWQQFCDKNEDADIPFEVPTPPASPRAVQDIELITTEGDNVLDKLEISINYDVLDIMFTCCITSKARTKHISLST